MSTVVILINTVGSIASIVIILIDTGGGIAYIVILILVVVLHVLLLCQLTLVAVS